MREQRDLCQVDVRVLDAGKDALDGVRGRGDLADTDGSVALVQNADVGEGAAAVVWFAWSGSCDRLLLLPEGVLAANLGPIELEEVAAADPHFAPVFVGGDESPDAGGTVTVECPDLTVAEASV